MNWQSSTSRSDPAGDPYAQYSSTAGYAGQQTDLHGMEQQHFLSSSTTREHAELARRKAEHLEAIEHIAPQQGYISPTYRSSRLTEKALREHFHLPLLEVAKKFGMCTTAFKKLCRKQGVMHWPQRTLKSLEKKIASLHAEQKFTSDQNHIEEQIRKLQAKREQILAGNGLTNLDHDADLQGTSPSDDSTNHLALDDSSSTASSSSYIDDRQDRRRHSADDIQIKDTGGGLMRRQHQDAGRDEKVSTEVGADDGTLSKGMRRAKTFGGLSNVQYNEHMSFAPNPYLANPQFQEMVPQPRPDPSYQLHRKDPNEELNAGAFYGGGPFYSGDPFDESGFGTAGGDAARSQMQGLLGENKSLRSAIRVLARERDEWMRRSLEAESELANYRAHCHQLEILLQNGMRGLGGGPGADHSVSLRGDSGRAAGGEEGELKMEGRDLRHYGLDLDPPGHDLL